MGPEADLKERIGIPWTNHNSSPIVNARKCRETCAKAWDLVAAITIKLSPFFLEITKRKVAPITKITIKKTFPRNIIFFLFGQQKITWALNQHKFIFRGLFGPTS